MKRALALVCVVVVGLAGVALAGIRLVPIGPSNSHYEWNDCDGGQGKVVADGTYLSRFKDETTWLCWDDAGCTNGGEFFPASLVMEMTFRGADGGTMLSCRSATSGGDVVMTLEAPGAN